MSRSACFVRSLLGAVLLGGLSIGNYVTAQTTRPAPGGAAVLYSPGTNLEHSELDMLRLAKASVDIAMYSFTDRELADELCRLARTGVRVRVYRDWSEYQQEMQRGQSVTPALLAAGVQVKVKAGRDLMHLKTYAIDGELLRTGSANWSPTGLKRQDNDVRYEASPELARRFAEHFAELWGRSSNYVPHLQEP